MSALESGSDVGREASGEAVAGTSQVFLVAVLAAVLLAGIAGGLSRPLVAGGPGYALDSGLVYRLEVGLLVFVALYLVIVLVRLASRGLTPSRVGTAAVDLPQLVASVGEAQAGLDVTATTAGSLFRELEDQALRLAEIEYRLSLRNATKEQERK